MRAACSRFPAHIRGAEIELNYQPDPHFFATASYSYLHTTLDTPSTFYNFPALPGINNDGAGVSCPANPFLPNQTFHDPGVPQHLFNVLANYKHESGWGASGKHSGHGTRGNHPIRLSRPGGDRSRISLPWLAPSQIAAFTASGGYYQAPEIPWQYTLNAAVFYSFQHYTIKFSIYNLTESAQSHQRYTLLRQ